MIELDKAFETLEKKILDYDFRYLVVETELTENHIERLMPSCKDRGRIKWIPETKDTRKLTLDKCDMFPRLYFNFDCFIKEFRSWLAHRNQFITKIQKGTYE